MITAIVTAGAKRESIKQISDQVYKVTTTAIPEHGKANQRVIALLAELLDIPKSSLVIVRGEGSKTKLIDIIE